MGKNEKGIVTRFAPSPTGLLHAGNYRTALFAYIFARQNGGKFILRIEDTDKARSKKEYEDNIVESLKWLGLEYDEFLKQSERTDIHASYIQKLIDSGHAFVSKETPKEPGGRTEVIRFKNPNKKIKWNDMIRGEIEFDTTEHGDFVIARSMTEPVFHLVVVVDDGLSGVTHIIRGEDHISNTARHILLYEALGFPVPTYAHLPLLLSSDRTKLSKRKGALPITAYRDRGFLSEAIINYLVLLGWNPGAGDQKDKVENEFFSMQELLKIFDLKKVQKSGAIFSEEKLLWFNRHYITKLSDAVFAAKTLAYIPPTLQEPAIFSKILPLLRERVNTFGEITTLFENDGELTFIDQSKPYKKEALAWKGKGGLSDDLSVTKKHLETVIDLIKKIDEKDFTSAKIKEIIWPYAEEKGKGSVLWPVRYALSGREKSPDPFTMAAILGKTETLHRLNSAYNLL